MKHSILFRFLKGSQDFGINDPRDLNRLRIRNQGTICMVYQNLILQVVVILLDQFLDT